MFMPWISLPNWKKLAIVGICKNAGKTTVLNAIMQHYNSFIWGVMSTGRDGEAEDVLFKTPKPRVHIHRHSIFCADALCMDAHGAAISILKKTAWQSGGKALWIARAERDIETEIGGPQSVTAQIACASELLNLGADKVIIDGSLDRKSIALSDSLDALILAVGASFGDMDAIQAELLRLLSLSAIPCFNDASASVRKRLLDSETIHIKRQGKWHNTELKSLIGADKQLLSLLSEAGNPSHIYLPGAYTGSINTRLGKHLNLQIVFRHPECIKLPATELQAFIDKHRPQCLIPFNIKAITLNSHAVGASPIDADSLRQNLRQRFPNPELIDIMEVNLI
jgi:hypothetical protein